MAQKYHIPVAIDVAILILRVGTSFFMVRHGFDKLQQLFSGHWDFPDPIGLGSTASALLTVFAEFFCSILLALGALSRPAAVILAFTMGVAAFVVHKAEGIDPQEHALLFLLIYLVIAITGPGKFSIDQRWVNKYFK
jgi:putative oxidoreductase